MPGCHSVYRLRDASGAELTGLWEVHVIELGKELKGDGPDNWVRLFHAESEEELEMLAAKNKGLAEAAEVMKRMSLRKALRYRYEAHLKAVRDRYGEDEYVRDQGRAEGKVEDVLQLLGELGTVPDALKERIRRETDLQVLGKWLKAAARAESISEFEVRMRDFRSGDR